MAGVKTPYLSTALTIFIPEGQDGGAEKSMGTKSGIRECCSVVCGSAVEIAFPAHLAHAALARPGQAM
jgi:hypothetical protein